MKIPKQLKIGGHIIKIDLSKELDGMNGQSIFKYNTIEICKNLPQSQKESTLIHEILHYLNSTLAANQIGHALHDSISEQFYQVLVDNKLLK